MKKLILVLALSSSACTSMFYVPSREKFSDPKKSYNVEYREEYFESTDGNRLASWYFPAAKGKKPRALVLQYHGNGENMSSHYQTLVWMVDEGFDLLTFDYRGYGASEGTEKHEGIYQDSLASLRYASSLAAKRNVPLIVYGQSIGASLLLRVLQEEKPPRLRLVVAESGFSSYQRIAREKLAGFWLTWPFQWLAWILVSDKYQPETPGLKTISPVPLVILHSEKDMVVPFHHGEKLFAAAAEPKFFWPHSNPGHINGMFVEELKYRKRLLAYIKELGI